MYIMPYKYMNQEYADIHFIYGFCNGNSRAAVREYGRRFPYRRQPGCDTFTRVHSHFRKHGLGKIGDAMNRRNLQRERRILNTFQEEPNISIRRACQRLDIPGSVILKTLRKNHLHAYHLHPTHSLHPGDAERRVIFCRWLLEKIRDIPDFSNKIVWTDESSFTRRGVINFHNLNVWDHENPHHIRPRNFQEEFKVNVWMGLIGNFALGPYILPDNVTGQVFLTFLREHHVDMMENVSLQIRDNCYFQLDGCPSHYFRQVRTWLDRNYPNKWIGRGGPVAWPPRSPDINPMDFLFGAI